MPVRTPPGLAGVLVALAAAVSLAEPAREEGPVDLGSGRVVLVPLNLAVRAVPEVEPGVAPVWSALLQYFAATQQPVAALERDGAASLWNEVMAEAGESAPRDLYAAYERFAQRVAEQTAYDHLVFSTLIMRAARVIGNSASWDGVHQTVPIPERPTESIDTLPHGDLWIVRHGARGELAAASLHVAVLSPAGELRFENTGGLVLLQEVAAPIREGGELRVVPSGRAFADAARLRESIATAFRAVRRSDAAEREP